MAPVSEAISQEYASKLRVLQMDADASPATMARFGVRGLPTMLVFRDGALLDRILGAVSRATMRERLDRLAGITAACPDDAACNHRAASETVAVSSWA
jgi:thioredoxin 1